MKKVKLMMLEHFTLEPDKLVILKCPFKNCGNKMVVFEENEDDKKEPTDESGWRNIALSFCFPMLGWNSGRGVTYYQSP
jgi:hypothetical protein